MTTGRAASLTPGQRLEAQDLSNRVTLHMGKGGIFIVATDNSRAKKAVERLLQKSLAQFAWYSSLDASLDTDVLLKIWGLVKEALDPSQTVFSWILPVSVTRSGNQSLMPSILEENTFQKGA